MPRKIEISHRTIVFTVLFLASFWFLISIRDIIMQIFVSLLIMIILNPTVTKLQKRHVPRAASVLIVYMLVLSFIVFTVATIVPPLVDQTAILATSAPRILEDLQIPFFVVDEVTRQLTQVLSAFPAQLLRVGISVVSNIFSVLTVLFFALYFLLSRHELEKQLTSVMSKKNIERVDRIIIKLEKDLGGWARGQLILMLIVGVFTYVGLMILGVPFALPLALLAALLEIVPNIGPLIATIPAIVVGFGVSPLTGMATAALSFLIQQIEVYLFVPKVMQRSANVSPIVTLLSLLIGFRVAGIVGAILSVPIFITSRVFLNEFVFKK